MTFWCSDLCPLFGASFIGGSTVCTVHDIVHVKGGIFFSRNFLLQSISKCTVFEELNSVRVLFLFLLLQKVLNIVDDVIINQRLKQVERTCEGVCVCVLGCVCVCV